MAIDPEQERHDRLAARLDSLAASLLDEWRYDEVAAHLLRMAVNVMGPHLGKDGVVAFLRAYAAEVEQRGIKGAEKH